MILHSSLRLSLITKRIFWAISEKDIVTIISAKPETLDATKHYLMLDSHSLLIHIESQFVEEFLQSRQ